MRRDISLAKSELWLRYAKEKEKRQRRERVAVLGASFVICIGVATAFPTALLSGNSKKVTVVENSDAPPEFTEFPTDNVSDEETLRGGASKGENAVFYESALALTDELSFAVVGSKNSPMPFEEYKAELLRTVREVRLYQSDSDNSSIAATLKLKLESGEELTFCITAERSFVLDGVTFRAENADEFFGLLAEAGAEFNDDND